MENDKYEELTKQITKMVNDFPTSEDELIFAVVFDKKRDRMKAAMKGSLENLVDTLYSVGREHPMTVDAFVSVGVAFIEEQAKASREELTALIKDTFAQQQSGIKAKSKSKKNVN